MKFAETDHRWKHWLDSWHVNPSVNRDYDFIDGLRGVAILMVIVAHHFYINPESGPVTHFIGAFVGAWSNGVTLFFALSGFLISWPFWKQKAAGSERIVPSGYAWRRFWKIYPPLAISILLLTPVYVFRNADWSYFPIAAEWLAGLPFLLPVSGKLNPVMWSLVVEVQFYLVLPLLVLSLKRVSPRNCLVIVTLVFLLAPFLMRVMTGQSATFRPDIDAHFPSALDTFCFGILIAGLQNLGLLHKGWVPLGVAGVVLWPFALLVFAWLDIPSGNHGFLVNEMVEYLLKFAAGCLLFFVTAPEHPIARVLCAPWLRWCGLISYEWYLLHQPIVTWARESFGPAGGDRLKFAAIMGGPLLISLILAAMIYRFFSLPILIHWRVKRSRATRARAERVAVN